MFAANHICAETPEEGTDQHSGVDGDGEAVRKGGLKLIAGVGGDDRLEE